MNKIFTKGLLIGIIVACVVASCEKPNDKEQYEVPNNIDYHTAYGIPDSVLNDNLKQILDTFFKGEESIAEKNLAYKNNESLGCMAIYLYGVKEKHLYIKVVNVDEAAIVSEYVSPDTIVNSYSYNIGYGENKTVRFRYEGNNFFPFDYLKSGSSEIVIWALRSWEDLDGGAITKVEFKTPSNYKTFYDVDCNRVVSGFNCLFYNDVCFSFEGDTLYTLERNALRFVDYISQKDLGVKFVSTEDVVIMGYTGEQFGVARFSLKNNKSVWELWKETEHNLFEKYNNPKEECRITNKEGSIWLFELISTSYSGKKVKFTTTVDIDNPPSELSITEEELN